MLLWLTCSHPSSGTHACKWQGLVQVLGNPSCHFRSLLLGPTQWGRLMDLGPKAASSARNVASSPSQPFQPLGLGGIERCVDAVSPSRLIFAVERGPHRQCVVEISQELAIRAITLYTWSKAWRLQRWWCSPATGILRLGARLRGSQRCSSPRVTTRPNWVASAASASCFPGRLPAVGRSPRTPPSCCPRWPTRRTSGRASNRFSR